MDQSDSEPDNDDEHNSHRNSKTLLLTQKNLEQSEMATTPLAAPGIHHTNDFLQSTLEAPVPETPPPAKEVKDLQHKE